MHPTPNSVPFVREAKAVPPLLLVAVVAAHAALKWIFFSEWFMREVALPVETLTLGTMPPAALAGGIQTLLVAVVGVAILGGLKAKHFGFTRHRLGRIVIVLLSMLVVILAVFGASTTPQHAVSVAKWWPGIVASATMGSAVPEELFYRGFLLVQVYLLLSGSARAQRERALFWSIVIVQAYFALNHVPAAARASLGFTEASLWLLQTALVGGVLSVFLLQTRNIILCIGAHALLNFSVALATESAVVATTALFLVCSTMLFGDRIFSTKSIGGSHESAVPVVGFDPGLDHHARVGAGV